MIGREIVRGKADDVGIDVSSVGVVEGVGVIVDVVDLVAGLDGVVAVDPGEGVDELVAAFIGIGGTIEHRRLAEAEAVGGDLDLGRAAVDVVREALLEERGLAAELALEVAAVLEVGFVEQVGREEEGPAADDRVFLDDTVAEAGNAIESGRRGLDAVERVPAHAVVLDG